jgi:predicted GH43/DUF377 family glycosyl hydrolase
MILTIKDNEAMVLSISRINGKLSIIEVMSEMRTVAELWVSRGVRYPHSHNHFKICNPRSKSFLADLREYVKQLFPHLQCSLSEI